MTVNRTSRSMAAAVLELDSGGEWLDYDECLRAPRPGVATH